MGVYIRDMEMPTRCGRCDMCVPEADGNIDWHNMCCITGADIVDVGEKMVDCPLVPVPPHGDLIDRQVLLEGEGRYCISLCKEGIDVEEILRAKTVIPAEEEKS